MSPEGLPERTAQKRDEIAVEERRFAEFRRQVAGEAEGVVPEGVDLHRISVPGRDGDLSHRGVHPGQGGPPVSGVEEAPPVHADSESRSVHERADDPFHDGPETFADQGLVARDPQKFLNGPEIPERTVHGVVGLGGAVRGEEIGQEAVPFVPADLRQDLDPFRDAAGGEAETGKGDQGVPSPAPEPGIAGDDGRPSRRGRDEKRTSGAEQGEEKLPIFTRESAGLSFVCPLCSRPRRTVSVFQIAAGFLGT